MELKNLPRRSMLTRRRPFLANLLATRPCCGLHMRRQVSLIDLYGWWFPIHPAAARMLSPGDLPLD